MLKVFPPSDWSPLLVLTDNVTWWNVYFIESIFLDLNSLHSTVWFIWKYQRNSYRWLERTQIRSFLRSKSSMLKVVWNKASVPFWALTAKLHANIARNNIYIYIRVLQIIICTAFWPYIKKLVRTVHLCDHLCLVSLTSVN